MVGVTMNGFKIRIMLITWVCFLPILASAQEPAPAEEPVRGGVTYEPILGEGDKLRDPFKSPFELEQEQEQENQASLLNDSEERLPYDIAELSLKGIYLAANTDRKSVV